MSEAEHHVPRPDGLYSQVQRLADAQLETNERMGQLMREVVELRLGQQKIAMQVSDLSETTREYRRKLESVPEMVREVAEDTGRHNVAELEAKLADRRADSLSVKLTRADDRRWQVLMAIIAAVVAALVAGAAGHFEGRATAPAGQHP